MDSSSTSKNNLHSQTSDHSMEITSKKMDSYVSTDSALDLSISNRKRKVPDANGTLKITNDFDSFSRRCESEENDERKGYEQLNSDTLNEFSILSETYVVEKQHQGNDLSFLKKRKSESAKECYVSRVDAQRILQSTFYHSGEPKPLSFLQNSNEHRLRTDVSTDPSINEDSLNDTPFEMKCMLQKSNEMTHRKCYRKSTSMFKSSKDHCGHGILQDCACTELSSDFTRCMECRQAEKDNERAYCRFRDFRRLIANDDGTYSPVTYFVCFKHYAERTSRSDAASISEWLPCVYSGHVEREEIEAANFIKDGVAPYFRKLLDGERKLFDAFYKNQNQDNPRCSPWKDSARVRELCDVCSTTVFNLHLVCPYCGLSVCSSCYNDRLSDIRRGDHSDMEDSFGWAYCTRNGDDASHQVSDMILAHLIPNCGSEILSTLDELERRLNSCAVMPTVQKPRPVPSLFESRFHHLFDGKVLILEVPQSSINLALFQEYWKLAHPVIVQNLHFYLSMQLWKPAVFAEKCTDHSSTDSIVDCRTGTIVTNITTEEFWRGFTDCSDRLRGPDDRKLYLKLKDWPPGEKFSSVLKEHYVDLCKALPIPEYTHPDKGRFNLATKLPSFCLAPDLGPKMYTAYDMIFEPEKGTTNLHLDVSDAVNILVNVTTPSNINPAYLYDAMIKYLETQGLDGKDLIRARHEPARVGALWTIFKPEDNTTIRKFLDELLLQKDNDVSDPIHDQKVYLHRDLRLRLEKEHGVKGFTFVQMLGDAVFIPAGAAHQVQNLLCCIKVAEDFVSPEGVHRCAIITNEFRALTKEHSNHEDKLQLANIVTHALRDSLGVLAMTNQSKAAIV